jgi:hypothetical protein
MKSKEQCNPELQALRTQLKVKYEEIAEKDGRSRFYVTKQICHIKLSEEETAYYMELCRQIANEKNGLPFQMVKKPESMDIYHTRNISCGHFRNPNNADIKKRLIENNITEAEVAELVYYSTTGLRLMLNSPSLSDEKRKMITDAIDKICKDRARTEKNERCEH